MLDVLEQPWRCWPWLLDDHLAAEKRRRFASPESCVETCMSEAAAETADWREQPAKSNAARNDSVDSIVSDLKLPSEHCTA